MKLVRALAFALLALAGCDGGLIEAADLSIASSCTGALDGAVRETITGCRVTWDEMSGVAEIGNDGDIVVSDPTRIDDSGANFGFALTVSGDFRAGTLSFANLTSAEAGVIVFGEGGQERFVATFSGTAPGAPPTFGSISANLTRGDVDLVTAAEQRWIVHGHLDATFVRLPPASGTDHVTMTLDF